MHPSTAAGKEKKEEIKDGEVRNAQVAECENANVRTHEMRAGIVNPAIRWQISHANLNQCSLYLIIHNVPS